MCQTRHLFICICFLKQRVFGPSCLGLCALGLCCCFGFCCWSFAAAAACCICWFRCILMLHWWSNGLGFFFACGMPCFSGSFVSASSVSLAAAASWCFTGWSLLGFFLQLGLEHCCKRREARFFKFWSKERLLAASGMWCPCFQRFFDCFFKLWGNDVLLAASSMCCSFNRWSFFCQQSCFCNANNQTECGAPRMWVLRWTTSVGEK